MPSNVVYTYQVPVTWYMWYSISACTCWLSLPLRVLSLSLSFSRANQYLVAAFNKIDDFSKISRRKYAVQPTCNQSGNNATRHTALHNTTRSITTHPASTRSGSSSRPRRFGVDGWENRWRRQAERDMQTRSVYVRRTRYVEGVI